MNQCVKLSVYIVFQKRVPISQVTQNDGKTNAWWCALAEGIAMQIHCKLSYFTSIHLRYPQLMYPSVIASICPLALLAVVSITLFISVVEAHTWIDLVPIF